MSLCRDRRSSRTEVWVIAVCTVVALLMTSAASAAKIANRGDKEVKLKITEGSSRQDVAIPVGGVVERVCQKGCIIRLSDSGSDDYELQGSENVSVEEGFLYYDPDQEVAPTNGSASGDQDRKKK